MHPNAEIDVTVVRESGIGFGQGNLSFHGAADGVDRAAKLRKHAVASGVSDTAPVRPNEPIQDFPARGKGV